jgi:hypothetical protein
MNKALVAVGAVGLGAGVMYLADPDAGRRRRARLRDAGVHASHTIGDAAGMTARDVEHRVEGIAARTLDRLIDEPPPGEAVLVARARARLGRLVSHPGAIEITARAGVVTVSGPVFAAEVDRLIAGLAAVRGVTGIVNRLEAHDAADQVPALQGPGPVAIGRVPASWRRWTPTRRLLAGVTGLALVVLFAPRPTLRGAAITVAGLELLERALLGGPPAV